MSTQAAGLVATSFSIFAMGTVLVYVPVLWQKMADIQSKLKMDMGEFNVLADDAWKEIMLARQKIPTSGVRKVRYAAPGGSICSK